MRPNFQSGAGANAMFIVWLRHQAISPLTPALSPLRGEGVALTVYQHLEAFRRVCSTSEQDRLNNVRATNAANYLQRIGVVRRAPSPLNGERAGVRVEAGTISSEPPGLDGSDFQIPIRLQS